MVKIDEINSKELKRKIQGAFSRLVTKQWLKEIVLDTDNFGVHYGRNLNLGEFFEIFIWDNLNDDQRNKIVEYLNILIEEDILIDRQPFGNYCFDLLDLAIVINKLCPGKVNYKPFIIWKEKKYYNLPQPELTEHPLNIELNRKIEYAFERKK